MTMSVLPAAWLSKTVWRTGLVVAGGICGTVGICQAQQTKGAKPSVQKDSGVRKLQPADVAGLPAEFVDKLNVRGCTIPQFGEVGLASEAASAMTTEPTNVIHGEFARHGQEDWAV